MERNAKRSFEIYIYGDQLRQIRKPVKWFRSRVLRLFQHFDEGPYPFFRENTAGPEDHEPQVVMKNRVWWQFQFHAAKGLTGGTDVFIWSKVALELDLSPTQSA